MILKQALVISLIALALGGCSSAVAGGSGPLLPEGQGTSMPNLDDAVTQGIQSGGVDRAIGGQ